MNLDSQVLESYVPVYDVIPEKWDEARPFIVEQLKKITNAVNIREIGWFLDEELLSGKAFIPGTVNIEASETAQQYRTILRKIIDFGSLPNSTVKSVPHGVIVDGNFTLIAMWACATDPIGLTSLSIPYANPTALNLAIALQMDSVNVNITTGTARSNYTRTFVVLEYTQEL